MPKTPGSMVASRSSSSPSRAPARRCSRPRSPSAPAGCGQRPMPRSLTKLKKPRHCELGRDVDSYAPHRMSCSTNSSISRPTTATTSPSSKSSLSATNAKPDLHDEPPDSASRPTRSPPRPDQRRRPDRHRSAFDRHRQRVLARPPRPRRQKPARETSPPAAHKARTRLPPSTAIAQRNEDNDRRERGQFEHRSESRQRLACERPRKATTRA